jgi:hypothetical protein
MSDFKSVKRSKADAARCGAKNRIFTFFGSKYMRKRSRALQMELGRMKFAPLAPYKSKP